MYNIGCANALKGQKNEALGWLEKALAAGFTQEGLLSTDSDLDPLRGEPRFKKLLGAPPEGLSREQRWSYDLDYLLRRMEKVHYSLYARVSREKLRAAVDDLKRWIPNLKDEEMAVGVQSILAMVGDGHTTMDWESRHGGKAARPRYPIQLYEYKEGLYVRGAEPALADLADAKVLRIGTVSAEEALKAAAPLCSHDNAMGIKIQAPMYLTDPAVLTYLKLAESMSGVAIVVKKSNGEAATVDLKPKVVSEQDEKKFVLANASAKAPEPLSFKKNDDRFWFEYLPEKKMVYFQYNAVANKPSETLEAFCGRMFSFVNEKPVDYLVIDMRNNGGGATTTLTASWCTV
jgi:hypothetical protein